MDARRSLRWKSNGQLNGSQIAQMSQPPVSEPPSSIARSALKRLELFICLLPVFGFFPAWWLLYKGQGNPAQRAVSRLAVTLALCWLSGYILLEVGANRAELPTLPLLIGSSMWTTTYFLVNFGLMVRLWRRQPLWLPGIGRISDRLP